jgi:hypothetical protein
MTGNREEKNRVLGFPVGSGARSGEYEEQHVMGFPASWFDSVNVDVLVWLVHPVREYRRWVRRRHGGSDGPGEDGR